MNFCINCGKQVDDNAQFCPYCGSQAATPAAAASAAQDTTIQAQPTATNAPAKKLPPVKLLVPAAILVVIILAAVFMSLNKTIKLSDYIVFSETGYDGYGTISASFDSEAFEADYAGKLKVKTSNLSEDDALEYAFISALAGEDDDVAMFFFEELAYGSLDQRSYLSNGDEVTWTWKYAEALSSYFNYKIDASDVIYTISLLEEVESFDAFATVTVSYSGYDGYGTAELSIKGTMNDYSAYYVLSDSSGLSNGDILTVYFEYDNLESMVNKLGGLPDSFYATYTVSGLNEVVEEDVFQYLSVDFRGISGAGSVELTGTDAVPAAYFSVSQQNSLSNGDTITITLNEDYLTSLVESAGIIPTKTSATYTVEGLGEYAGNMEDLKTSGLMDTLEAEAMAIYESDCADTWNTDTSIVDLVYQGSYLLSSDSGNKLYLVFETTVELPTSEQFTYYWYCCFSNVIDYGDGEFEVDTSSYTIPTCSYFLWTLTGEYVRYDNYYFSGYESTEAIYNAVIATKLNTYTLTATAQTVFVDESEDVEATDTDA